MKEDEAKLRSMEKFLCKNRALGIDNMTFRIKHKTLWDGESTDSIELTECIPSDVVIIPDFVDSLADGLFDTAKTVKRIVVPKHIKKLPERFAFNAYSLVSVDAPGVEELCIECFWRDWRLVELNTDKLRKLNESCLSRTAIENLDLSKVTFIGSHAFHWWTGKNQLFKLDNLEEIRFDSFNNTPAFGVEIGPKCRNIPNYVFRDCELTHLKFSEGLQNIAESAFVSTKYSGKNQIYIPSSVDILGGGFGYSRILEDNKIIEIPWNTQIILHRRTYDNSLEWQVSSDRVNIDFRIIE